MITNSTIQQICLPDLNYFSSSVTITIRHLKIELFILFWHYHKLSSSCSASLRRIMAFRGSSGTSTVTVPGFPVSSVWHDKRSPVAEWIPSLLLSANVGSPISPSLSADTCTLHIKQPAFPLHLVRIGTPARCAASNNDIERLAPHTLPEGSNRTFVLILASPFPQRW